MDRQAEAAETRQAPCGERITQFRSLSLSSPPLFCPGCRNVQSWEMGKSQLIAAARLGEGSGSAQEDVLCSCGVLVNWVSGRGEMWEALVCSVWAISVV